MTKTSATVLALLLNGTQAQQTPHVRPLAVTSYAQRFLCDISGKGKHACTLAQKSYDKRFLVQTQIHSQWTEDQAAGWVQCIDKNDNGGEPWDKYAAEGSHMTCEGDCREEILAKLAGQEAMKGLEQHGCYLMRKLTKDKSPNAYVNIRKQIFKAKEQWNAECNPGDKYNDKCLEQVGKKLSEMGGGIAFLKPQASHKGMSIFTAGQDWGALQPEEATWRPQGSAYEVVQNTCTTAIEKDQYGFIVPQNDFMKFKLKEDQLVRGCYLLKHMPPVVVAYADWKVYQEEMSGDGDLIELINKAKQQDGAYIRFWALTEKTKVSILGAGHTLGEKDVSDYGKNYNFYKILQNMCDYPPTFDADGYIVLKEENDWEKQIVTRLEAEAQAAGNAAAKIKEEQAALGASGVQKIDKPVDGKPWKFYDYSCDTFASQSNWCDQYGDWDRNGGKASDVCVACGGGYYPGGQLGIPDFRVETVGDVSGNGDEPAADTSTEGDDSSGGGGCTDKKKNGGKWTDREGDNCATWERNNWCSAYGAAYGADKACCACGGGDK